MDSRVSREAGFTQTNADTSGQDNTFTNTNWLEDELRACGVPEFGLDQWLRHFMEEALAADMPDEKLLNFFCLARDKALSDDPEYVDILERTEAVLFARMPDGLASAKADIEDMGYEPEEHADAMEDLCAGKLSDRHLVELFDLSATLRAEPEVGHMWLAVMYLSRVQLLGRMKRVRQGPPASEDDVDNKDNDDDGDDPVSMRDALRIAEEAFRPDISDAQLLDLYILVEEYSNPDEEVFDEIADAVSAMMFDRLRRGAPDPAFERYLEGFDYPDHGKQALKAVLAGGLPHKNLLMLYQLSWDRDRSDRTWLAINDLCRGQILDRMTPSQGRGGNDYQDLKLLQLARRIQAYR